MYTEDKEAIFAGIVRSFESTMTEHEKTFHSYDSYGKAKAFVESLGKKFPRSEAIIVIPVSKTPVNPTWDTTTVG